MINKEKKYFLVTGGAGFIGARVVEFFNQLKIPVISVDEIDYFSKRAEHRGINFGEKVSIKDLFSWLQEKKELKAIIHLGACTDTTETNLDYLKRVNLEYSKTLWRYATENKIPMVYASSAATYGNGELGYSDEENLIPKLVPLNLYGKSKQDFDLWALEEEKEGRAPPAWCGFKFFNVYGFGERHKGEMSSVVLKAFDQIRASGKVKLFKSHRAGVADGEQKRDFIYVSDVVDAIHFALKSPIGRGIYNLGTGQARSFLDLVRAVFKELSIPEEVQFFDTPLAIRDKYQYWTEAQMKRLRATGYTKPFTTLEEGIHQYIQKLRHL